MWTKFENEIIRNGKENELTSKQCVKNALSFGNR